MKHKCMHGPACDDASPSIGDQREISSVGLLFIGAQPSGPPGIQKSSQGLCKTIGFGKVSESKCIFISPGKANGNYVQLQPGHYLL